MILCTPLVEDKFIAVVETNAANLPTEESQLPKDGARRAQGEAAAAARDEKRRQATDGGAANNEKQAGSKGTETKPNTTNLGEAHTTRKGAAQEKKTRIS